MNRSVRQIIAGVSLLCISAPLAGCGDIALLDPKGPVGAAELYVIGVAFALMLIVIIPVTIMALWFPRRYRASDPKGDYDPNWSHSHKIDLVVWLVPAAIVAVLGTLVWVKSHQLDPSKPIDSAVSPIDIEAVALDWKWLFIYPQQNVAAVNQLVLPVKVPVRLKITSDTVVTSFFIPRLGSQIYAMAGRKSRLYLMADERGIYHGQNQQFSGRGYADMNFKVLVTSRKQFDGWVRKTKHSPEKLDLARYDALRKPSSDVPVTSFSWVRHDLFDEILDKYRNASDVASHQKQLAGIASGRH